jgi:hypothetical protein
LKLSPTDLQLMKDKIKELNQVNTELGKLSQELKGLDDIAPLIQEIRKHRIIRVRAERAIRKVEREKAKAERKAEITEKQKNTPTYLGEKIAVGLKYDDINTELLQKNALPLIQNLSDLSEATHLTREQLLWLSYHRKTATIDHYTRFQIPKRKGGMRSISSPKGKLRTAQSWIEENILTRLPVHPAAMAFQAEKSIVHNAQIHAGQNIVMRIDLKDFYPSIKFLRVKGLFQSFGYSTGMATVFALLCTDAMRIGATLDEKKYFVALGERYLPQGACTSPAITNLICRKLDNRLYKLAESLGWRYSRYADDLVFSNAENEADLKKLSGLVRKILSEETFEINEEKTLVMRPHQRQTVTGVVVNGGEMRLSKRDIRKFRAFLHQYTLHGVEAMSKKIGKNATQYAKGYWSFMHMVSPSQAEKFKQQYAWLVS